MEKESWKRNFMNGQDGKDWVRFVLSILRMSLNIKISWYKIRIWLSLC